MAAPVPRNPLTLEDLRRQAFLSYEKMLKDAVAAGQLKSFSVAFDPTNKDVIVANIELALPLKFTPIVLAFDPDAKETAEGTAL